MMISADALLFDMDGTLVDSGAVVEECWAAWAAEYGISPAELAARAGHGIPARQIAAALLPAAVVPEAVARIEQLEIDRAGGLRVLPGTRELLSVLPDGAWAIVTSCTRALAEARLKAVGLVAPTLVTADDVARGKPDPEPFALGARLLGVAAGRCVVFEDAPAGLAAARGAGARTVAVATTHAAARLEADVVVGDLSCVDVRPGAGGGWAVRAG
ncbi:sugar-phosphatase [Nocardiopsis mwathae]|uniref:Sugar-phosphatase n=1 Tax=Nocardiopsis mwathae TaxID=1472723 RepID=A0A7W9YGR7_9ACTN|nr:HAD-IA family hydrolase [Nocardiopsis mwathae]MBB6171807.1 sugar-phosphatase [Nocardiopsis mwathae]